MEQTTVSLIEMMINKIKLNYNASINFHDILGLNCIDPKMSKVFDQYLYHNNPFCNEVKKTQKGFVNCVECKNKIYNKLKNNPTDFYGTCYMGIGEIIVPITLNKKVIAFLCIGEFSKDKEASLEKLKKQTLSLGLDYKTLEELFFDLVEEINFSIEELIFDAKVLAELIVLAYLKYSFEIPSEGDEKVRDNNIILSTVKFIQKNFNKPISLKTLASNSYCNPSYLSFLFKDSMGVGISEYINQLRISKAKELLDISGGSVTDIAFQVGYNDSGYFSKIFKNIVGCTPKEYKTRKK